MKQLAIWILGLIECLILLMMKFIKVLEEKLTQIQLVIVEKGLKFLELLLSLKAQVLVWTYTRGSAQSLQGDE